MGAPADQGLAPGGQGTIQERAAWTTNGRQMFRVAWHARSFLCLEWQQTGRDCQALSTKYCQGSLSGCGAALYPTGMLALGPIAPSRFLACSRLLSFCNTAARFGAAPRDDDDDDDNIPR
ncbi:hypothetical protein IG631_17610 [Alternaria alternata]|nr:hypothetical protein IG631_17610 [Alternaria alternata]